MAKKYTVTIEIETRGEMNQAELVNALCKGLNNDINNMQDYRIAEIVSEADVPDIDDEE